MKKIEIITDNRMMRNRTTILKALKQYVNKDVLLTIQPLKRNRSNQQNRYYWGVIIPLVQSGLEDVTGEMRSKNEVHEFLKFNFNYKEIVNQSTGEIYREPKTTTTNSTTDMEVYHEEIRRFAHEFLSVEIPLPNEDLELFE